MHWVDVESKRLQSFSERHVIATGITPSGDIHVGNMREILTGEVITRGLKQKNVEAQLIYIGDTIDPLRKVYPFLDESYKEHVGKPLSEIPCPCSSHKSYAEHFLTPFLDAAKTLGIEANVLLSHEMYAQGMYTEASRKVLDNKDRIKEILQDISKRDLPDDWFPYNPKCSECGRLTTTKVIGYEFPYVNYTCSCGHEGKADLRKDDGKLPWRVDWPARWWFLGVTFEPFGKDHAAAGGSYDTAKRISEEVFDRKAPQYVVYEWIQLKGKGAMSSSTGVVISAAKMLKMTPPEVFRYFVLRNNPIKHLDFDPGLGILNLVDEYDSTEKRYFEGSADDKSKRIEKIEEELARTYELSQPFSLPSKLPLQIPYRHLVSVVQINEDFEGILDILKRAEHFESLSKEDENHLKQRIGCVKFWLDNFAPEKVKFSIAKETPKITLESDHKKYLEDLSIKLTQEEWAPDAIHNAIYELAQIQNIKSKTAFQLVYQAILDQKHGPRLGYFLSTLDKGFVVGRIGEVAK
ncbi:MAG: lysine--tRNA ligase [Thermoplasmata archaeon]|nr:MAG: lysine--tRNA ligase [Thermoplasmata archaeon]